MLHPLHPAHQPSDSLSLSLPGLKDTDQIQATEAYSCLSSCKLYALHQAPYQIFVLYSTKIPVYALGYV